MAKLLNLSPLSSGFLYSSKFSLIFLFTIVPVLAGLTLAFSSVDLVSASIQGPIIYMAVIAAILVIVGFVWKIGKLEAEYKRAADNFAHTNNLALVPAQQLLALVPPSLKPLHASNFHAKGYRLGTPGQDIIIFDYSYTLDHNRQPRTYRFALCALVLGKSYPHLYLDGRANGKNQMYDGSQKVSLEGDFDKYFSLYVPAGSATGALTIFAPDMMQTLVDQGRQFDVEVEGDTAVLITRGQAFTQRSFGPLLAGAQAVAKEFAHLDVSWQPVYDNKGKSYALKERGLPLVLLLAITVVLAIIIFQMLPLIDFSRNP